MILFVLGRQPEIGLAEIAAIYGRQPQLAGQQLATMDIDAVTALSAANRLGSVVKIAKVVQNNFTISRDHLAQLCQSLFAEIEGKLTIGVSYYGPKVTKKSAIDLGRTIQTILRNQHHSVRLIPNDQSTLGSATILHNGLAHNNPKKVELIFTSSLVAQTIYVQDINAYSFRDRRRPRRDAHNGMLPPKLAQTMINLAYGAKRQSADQPVNLLDPFCGTGVILQEAALMGMNIYGTDLNSDMIANTKINLQWLNRTHRIDCTPNLAIGDATTFDWQSWAKPDVINLVATETYLGRPYTDAPSLTELKYNITACNVIIDKFLHNLSRQLPRGAGLCVGVPAWFIRDHIHHLPCITQINKYGFANRSIGANLIYHRPDQLVGRELLVLQKR